MTDKIEVPSWAMPPLSQDWQQLLEYIRPKTPEELQRSFGVAPPLLLGVKPPSPPTTEELPPPNKKPPRTILEELRIHPDEFAELALQQPELWEPDELEKLHQLAAGDINVQEVDALVKGYFSGARAPKKTTSVLPRSHDYELDTRLSLPLDLPGVSSIPDLETLEKAVDIGKWWEKR